jgi:hypothetical protein
MNYTIDSEWFDEGGYCNFYPLLDETNKGFKEFKSEKDAKAALFFQQLLSKYGLSPIAYTDVVKLPIKDISLYSSYGFVTEIAEYLTTEPITRWSKKYTHFLEKIQDLVEDIKHHTNLDFWDCHQYNIGLINDKLVCIDTGLESFDPASDAWGLGKPGPQCYYCYEYFCKCEEPDAIY